MKFRCIFFTLMISSGMLYCQQSKNQNPNSQPNLPLNNGPTISFPGGFSIVVNTANQAQLNQNNRLDQQANHLSMPQTAVQTQITTSDPDLKQKLYEFCQQQSTSFLAQSSGMISWMQNNSLKTTGVGLLFLYGCINYQIYQSNLIINNPQSWSNWHHGRSLEDLFATPQSALETDLLFAIQTKYVHPINPTDFIYSLMQSSIGLNKEMQIIQDQIWIYTWLQTCYCMPAFFTNPEELAVLQEKHRKLAFIKHLFASWCATYKIERNS